MAFIRAYRHINSETMTPIIINSRFIVEFEANPGANKDTYRTRLLVSAPGGSMEYRYSKEDFERLLNMTSSIEGN